MCKHLIKEKESITMKKTIAIVLTLILCVGLLAGCGAKDDKTITVAASPTPHAEILKVAAEVLAKDGWTLDIKEYTDYVQPNLVVDDGDDLLHGVTLLLLHCWGGF